MMMVTIMWAYLGNTQAEYRLGHAYLYGYGVTKNYQRAEHWLLRAAQQGSDAAGKSWTRLVLSLSAQWDHQQPHHKQFDWYHIISAQAQANDRPAQFQLGLLFQYRQTYASLSQALMWYRRAAASYYPPALLKLGFVYDRGIGVRPDKWLAQHYLRLGRLYWR